MAVISTPNASTIKITYDQGTDLNGDRIIKTKSYSSVKSAASNEDIMAVVNAIVALQDHTLSAVNRLDSYSLSE